MSRTARSTVLRCTSALISAGLAATALSAAAVAPAQAASSKGGKITRSEVIARAQYWVDQGVPYNQSGYHTDGAGTNYREDCSGYVSMAWHATQSYNTWTLPSTSTEVSKSSLLPGDALNHTEAHVILFGGWKDRAAGTFTYYAEQNSNVLTNKYTANINSSSVAGWPTSLYKGLRYDNIIDDPTQSTPSTYSGDLPVSGRWTVGAASTVGVFRDGTWALRAANGATTAVNFGQAGDLPMTGDFDGVGHDQLGIFRPSTSTFTVRHDDGSVTSLAFGQAGDIPVSGMWDNNGHAQMAVYRPSTGTCIVRHDDGSVATAALGQAGDIPIVGDWDGAGHAQMGVFRPGVNAGEENVIALRHDDGSVTTAAYGIKGDLPVVGDWSSKGRTAYGVYRPGSATFALSNLYAGTADTIFTYGNGGTWS
ncbi:hypothetical protein [Streptomyces sp. NPDC085540]|uniref:hypothetical protein n=1 Tax=Streptomyces sp. NPDC085540 TaxID=3365730 RepID=UPI0037D830E0